MPQTNFLTQQNDATNVVVGRPVGNAAFVLPDSDFPPSSIINPNNEKALEAQRVRLLSPVKERGLACLILALF